MQEVTISDASRLTRLSRPLIYRALAENRIKRGPNRGVYFEEVQRLHRPLLRGRPPNPPDARSRAFLRAKPYLGNEDGAARLREMLKVCGYVWGARGRSRKFEEILTVAFAAADRGNAEAKEWAHMTGQTPNLAEIFGLVSGKKS